MTDRKAHIPFWLVLAMLFSPSWLLAAENSLPTQQTLPHISTDREQLGGLPADEPKLRIGQGDPIAGKSKAEMCFGCHGEDGNSTDPQYPKLAGQYAAYIIKQIRNYLAGTRSHQVMTTMASSINDDDLADIAAYFASQPTMKGGHPSSNRIGKQLFDNDDLSRMMVRCSSCHGPEGKGLSPGNPVYPVIGGQHKDYLLSQLMNFKNGSRNNSTGGVMNVTVHRLSRAELEALAEYISGL
jgi:cytochrome c553